MSFAGGASRRQSHRDGGSVWTRVVPEHGTHVVSDQFKAGLAEVRAEQAGLDMRLSMEIAGHANRDLPGRLR